MAQREAGDPAQASERLRGAAIPGPVGGVERFKSIIHHGIGAADACAALLAHLAEYAPLTLAVHSGGKSVHGWFYAAGRSDDQLRPFMAYALGADPATWSPHQFVRMPDGTRENGRPQAVYFFNPETLP